MGKQHEKNISQGMEIVKKEEKDGWIPIVYGMDERNTPPEGKYILLSFSNFSLPAVGRYEGGSFFLGDEDEPLTHYGIFVNAWQPLPECYKEVGEMKNPYEGTEPYEAQPIKEEPLLDQIDSATLIAWFRCYSCYTCKWRKEVLDKDINHGIEWCSKTHEKYNIVDMVRYLGYSKE